jgi:hypothetical protein
MIPQRKKTAEEIAKLRESMGLPGASVPDAAAPPEASAPPAETPAIPPTTKSISPAAAASPETTLPPADPRPPVAAKPVRSLRKSERLPAPSSAAPASIIKNTGASNLPTHRRTESELSRLRRAQASENQQPPAAHLIALTANPFIVGVGYALAFVAAFLPVADYRYWFHTPFAVTATLAGLAILIAGFIFLKKKRSVHNACFIAAIAFFILVFSALYYFPHLRNAP